MIRIIGDVHGKIEEYISIASQVDYSIQIGDMGFDYDLLIRKLSPVKHKFIPGNHDNYDDLPKHALKKFGVGKVCDFEFFYVRGGHSIDYVYRMSNYVAGNSDKSWWEQEELTQEELRVCIRKYVEIKPDVVITHVAPFQLRTILDNGDLSERLGFSPSFCSRTEFALGIMLEAHHPKKWFFGHWHKTQKYNLMGVSTEFQCINELEYVDYEF